ncbi:TlpA disulfide reductase family protein [Solibacillus sp. FSL W7-1436]|uniref:TlpA disulfide reductase family protein n=1 Tax=unclassified Solibacillus TaxID=2637870 RepID=UPI0030F9B84C
MIKKLLAIVLLVLLGGYATWDYLAGEKTKKVNEPTQEMMDAPEEQVETGAITSDIPVAQDFTLPTLNGEPVSLSDSKGKITIVNFWATWCPPCREEMPHMQSFYEKHHEEVEILAVNVKNMDDGRPAIEQFVQEHELTFPILLDESGEVGLTYEIMTLPTSYILDAEGRVFQKIIGAMDEQVMNELVEALRSYE